jgi:histidine triad (HIT) family protein
VREVFRSEHCVAFFPTEPATLGHTLLIPRLHVPDIWSLGHEDGRHLADAIVRLAHAIREATDLDGLNIIQSNGQAATQTVDHLHVHLVPRWYDDDVGRIWPPETDYSERDKNEAWLAIRASIRSFQSTPNPQAHRDQQRSG